MKQVTRVLIVDDSAVFRKVLTNIIGVEPDFEVVGTASNGALALEQLSALKPDAVVLDVEMPVMDGLQTLIEIRRLRPDVPVFMLSALTGEGTATTVEALVLGATECFVKSASSQETIRNELVPRMRAVQREHLDRAPSIHPAHTAQSLPLAGLRCLAVGASTGGPDALARLLTDLGPNFPAPIVIVQHMPPDFTRLLAERLSIQCKVFAREGIDGHAILPGEVWIAPGGYHMVVSGRAQSPYLVLTKDPPECMCRPAVDPLFRSVAKVFGARALAVVLTGMGSDGLRGAKVLSDSGARILVQDAPSSVVWGMPGSIAQAGLADLALPIPELAQSIWERFGGVNRSPGMRLGEKKNDVHRAS